MKKRVILIDDSLTQLTRLKDTLIKSGFDVIALTKGSEAISLVYQQLPDLIVSDIFMPEINGYQVCRLLRSDNLTKNIPIILITNREEKISKFWSLRSGANAFILKDVNFESTLSKEMDRILRNVIIPCDDEEERKKLTKKGTTIPADYIQNKINTLLDQSLIESTIINEFRNLSEIVHNHNILKNVFFVLLASILDYNVAGIFFNERDEKKEKVLSLSACNVDLDESTVKMIEKDFFNVACPEDYSLNTDIYVTETVDKTSNSDTKIDDILKFKSKVNIPITFGNKVLGGICVYHLAPNKYNSSKVLNIVYEELKVIMRIKWLHSETRYLAITDGLTNLYNRRFFQQVMEKEFARSKRSKSDLSVIMVDIDFFKKLNDTYGHQFGDRVLAEVSKIIKNSLRRTDYVARYGGEEFIAILPDTNINDVIKPVQRMIEKIKEYDFKYGNTPVKVTVSLGIAAVTDNVNTEQELIYRVDKALYTAKANGRDRLEYYQEE